MSLNIQIASVEPRTIKKKIHNGKAQVGGCSKRYSEFRDLHKALTDNRPLLQGQGQKIPKVPTWTNLGALFSNKLSPQNLQKRRKALEKWLNQVSPINVARSFDDFRKFLKLTRRGFAQWANLYGGILKVDPKTKKVKQIKIDPSALLSKTASNSSFAPMSDHNIRTPSPLKNYNGGNKTNNSDQSTALKESPLSGIIASRTVEDLRKLNFNSSKEDLSDIEKQQGEAKEEDKNLSSLKANTYQNLPAYGLDVLDPQKKQESKSQENKSEERQFIQNYQKNNHTNVQRVAQQEEEQQQQKQSKEIQSKKFQQISFDAKLFQSIGAGKHGRNLSNNSFGGINSARLGNLDLSALLNDQDDFDQSGLDRSVILDFSDPLSSQHRFGKSFMKIDSETQQQIEVQEQGSGINTSFQLKSSRYFAMKLD